MKYTSAVLEVAGYIFHPHRPLLHLMGAPHGVQWDVNQALNQTIFCVYIYGVVHWIPEMSLFFALAELAVSPTASWAGEWGHGLGWAGSLRLGQVGSNWDCRASIKEETRLTWLESHWKCSDPTSCPVGGARTHCVAVFASGCLRSEKFHRLSPQALAWEGFHAEWDILRPLFSTWNFVTLLIIPVFHLPCARFYSFNSFFLLIHVCIWNIVQQRWAESGGTAALSVQWVHSVPVCPWWVSVLGQMLLIMPEAELVVVLLLGSVFVSAATVCQTVRKHLKCFWRFWKGCGENLQPILILRFTCNYSFSLATCLNSWLFQTQQWGNQHLCC